MAEVAPYGTWTSPITAASLVEASVRLANPVVDGDAISWVEGRPEEAGRQVVVRLRPGGVPEDLLPAGFAARTLVHEYGGLCHALGDGILFFANHEDQRLYRVLPGSHPQPITPAPPRPRADRYAAPVLHPTGAWLYCVRERHRADGVENDVVRIPVDGADPPEVMAGGHDFYSFPTVSPDGSRMAWTCWDHPAMPWDGTELVEVAIGADGAVDRRAGAPRLVAGGAQESVTEPRYGPDGRLHWISDRSGWWNLYRDDGGPGQALAPIDAELGGPDWVFGRSSYTFLPDGTIVACWSTGGRAHLGTVVLDGGPEAGSGSLVEVEVADTVIGDLQAFGDGVVAIVGSGARPPSLVAMDLAGGAQVVLRASRELAVDPAYLSMPEAITFPTLPPDAGAVAGAAAERPGSGAGPDPDTERPEVEAHAFYYPPTNPDFQPPPGDLPPLIVQSHGGPTSAAVPVLDLRTQFWTSRGFGVVDVDYGGSTGYGRPYRQRLQGNWGVVDVQDCVQAAQYLVAAGRADPRRLVIHGGSAGGYTTLCALTFTDVFAAGASWYGVADVSTLAQDTHKFESHYLDGLIGPWPEAEARYRARSPIHHVERLRTPVVLFQGMEDAVVPPAQTQQMVDALERNHVPHAVLYFPGEQHGFRMAATIRRTVEVELAFYGAVLGFEPADAIEPVTLRHLGRQGEP